MIPFAPPNYRPIAPPNYKDLKGQVVKEASYFDYGGFSTVYRGLWTEPPHGITRRVAVKILRGVQNDPQDSERMTRRLIRETLVWHTLTHDNVLPFYGICSGLAQCPAMISPLCVNGNVVTYLANHNGIDRFAIVCDITSYFRLEFRTQQAASQVLGVAEGLKYLHSKDVIHGDMKPHNVLIGDNGVPRLCDFGRARIISHRGFTTQLSGTPRFMAPELLNEPEVEPTPGTTLAPPTVPTPQPTKKSDIYGFSMVALQILTSKPPFYHIQNDHAVIFKVVAAVRPELRYYPEMTSHQATWEIFGICWNQDPILRPSMEGVVRHLTPS